MIIWLIGPSASGKSTINYKVVERLGPGYKNKKHSIPFYSFDDIITIGRYHTSGRELNGTDGVMAGKDKVKKFFDIEYSKWRHMFIDGTKFVTEDMFDHLIKYNFKVFYLSVPTKLILERSQKRNNGWDQKNTDKKRILEQSKYDIILNNPKYKKHIEIRENLNMEDSDNITKEILDILQPTKSGELFFD